MTLARIAALVVARSCAWLSVPFSRRSAGEVDQRLLLRQRPQHRHRGLQRRQLPIGVEDVELGVVLAERRAQFRIVREAVAVLIVAVDQLVDDLAQLRPVVGEVLLDPDGAAFERP